VNRGEIKGRWENIAVAASLEILGRSEDLALLRKVCYLMRDAYGSDGP
jgi:hypothetical protein